MQNRIGHIDGLRGLAALLVLFGHVLEQANRQVYSPAVEGILDWSGFGRIGVVAFFCISGFVIPFSFRSDRPVAHFLISRFFRLYPAFWLSIGIALAVAAVYGKTPPPDVIWANLTMIQGLLGRPDIIGVYWTLLIEILFYALSVGLFVLGVFSRPRWVAVCSCAFALLAILGAAARFAGLPALIPVGMAGYLAIMLFGTVIRYATVERNPDALRILPGLLAFILLGIVIVGLAGYDATNMPERPRADFLGVFLGIGLFLSSWTMRSWLSRPTMQWLGAVSYSLYLLHSPCVSLVSGVAAGIHLPAAKVAILALSFPLSLIAAHFTYRWIERPMIALGRRLASGLPQPRPADT